MKKLLLTFASLALTAPAALLADSYSVFRICEDQHVLRTSDGAEAGRVEYIIVEPSQQRIVSTVITGGVVGEKFVAVPFSVMRFGGEREITLTEITRERLVAAPVIERTHFTARAVIEPALIQPTFAHFKIDISHRSTEVTRPEGRPAPPSAAEGTGKARATTERPDPKAERARTEKGEPAERTTKEGARTGERGTERAGRKPGATEDKPDKPGERVGRKPDATGDKPDKATERVGRKPDANEDKPDKATERPGHKPDQAEGKPGKAHPKTGEKDEADTPKKGHTPGTEGARKKGDSDAKPDAEPSSERPESPKEKRPDAAK